MPGGAKGRVVIVSGPSGVGKTTVLRHVYQRAPVPLVHSVSATTRPPRPSERDGVDYHFLTAEAFQRLKEQGEFIEYFQVFDHGYWYGTLRSEVAAGLTAGKGVVLGIDVQGALAVMQEYRNAISIFLAPSTMEELERRLRLRGTEDEEAIGRRLARAKCEISLADRYAYRVVNDDLEQAVDEICTILTKQWETHRDD
jgi:guanylate kinase